MGVSGEHLFKSFLLTNFLYADLSLGVVTSPSERTIVRELFVVVLFFFFVMGFSYMDGITGLSVLKWEDATIETTMRGTTIYLQEYINTRKGVEFHALSNNDLLAFVDGSLLTIIPLRTGKHKLTVVATYQQNFAQHEFTVIVLPD